MHKGIWGHVLDEDWTMNNAQVVCSQLKKPGVKSFQLLKTEISSEDRVIWLKDVRCKGNEKRLFECTRSVWIEQKKQSVSCWKAVLECIPGEKYSRLLLKCHQN